MLALPSHIANEGIPIGFLRTAGISSEKLRICTQGFKMHMCTLHTTSERGLGTFFTTTPTSLQLNELETREHSPSTSVFRFQYLQHNVILNGTTKHSVMRHEI